MVENERRRDQREMLRFIRFVALVLSVMGALATFQMYRLNDTVDHVERLVINATGEEASKAQQAIVLVLIKEHCRTQKMIQDPNVRAVVAEDHAMKCATDRLVELEEAQKKVREVEE